MAVDNLKHFVLRNKELLMFLVGFGAMHYGWYNLQRNSTLNKALATSHEKEVLKEYKRLEREMNEKWPEPKQVHKQQQLQNSGVILTAATAFTEKTSNTN